MAPRRCRAPSPSLLAFDDRLGSTAVKSGSVRIVGSCPSPILYFPGKQAWLGRHIHQLKHPGFNQLLGICFGADITLGENTRGKTEAVTDFTFLDSKITADSDCSHQIKRCLLPGRKAIMNIDSILKSRDITLLTKVHTVKAMMFPVVMYGCEDWTIKKAKHKRIGAFKLWCWKRLLRVPWTARRSNQSILKEINPECSLKGCCWSWSSNTLATWYEELTNWKRPCCWERLKAKGEGGCRGWDG